ncbi:MAG: rod shape-determining protein MreC [Proteobacteria bacterium]|nr:rod shape-determining protein MreC [Pseudomonadota bacterium]
MPDFWSRIRAPMVLALLVVITVITMASDRDTVREGGRDLPWWQGLVLDVTTPLRKLVAAPAQSLESAWASYGDLLDVREENERLRARVAALEEEALQYREALVTSGHLQNIAAMRDDFEVPMLASEVVGLDVSPWFRSVLVDRGRRHGLQAGYPVITDAGLVGLVTATSSNAARTMLLLDRQSAIGGIVQRSRARGIVRGTGRGELEFEFVVRGSDVQVGDVVITSGLGGVYPKGLRVGEVVEVSDPGARLLQKATLRPAVDFGKLEQVFVLLQRGRGMDLLFGAELESAAAVSERPAS